MDMPVPERGFAFYSSQRHEALTGLRATPDVLSREVDLSAAVEKNAVLEAFARSLDFPSSYLPYLNYDSFEAAVRDLSWLPFDKLVLVLTDCSRQWADDYAVMATMLEILADTHAFWQQRDKVFFVAFVA